MLKKRTTLACEKAMRPLRQLRIGNVELSKAQQQLSAMCSLLLGPVASAACLDQTCLATYCVLCCTVLG